MTPCEVASQAVAAIRALNDLTHGGGELANAAGQAADMMTAALNEARTATAALAPAR